MPRSIGETAGVYGMGRLALPVIAGDRRHFPCRRRILGLSLVEVTAMEPGPDPLSSHWAATTCIHTAMAFASWIVTSMRNRRCRSDARGGLIRASGWER